MASGTFKLPSGSKIRTASSRRFVVVDERKDGRAFVDYRSDDLQRAVIHAAKRGGVVLDTVGRKVRVPSFARSSALGASTWVDA